MPQARDSSPTESIRFYFWYVHSNTHQHPTTSEISNRRNPISQLASHRQLSVGRPSVNSRHTHFSDDPLENQWVASEQASREIYHWPSQANPTLSDRGALLVLAGPLLALAARHSAFSSQRRNVASNFEAFDSMRSRCPLCVCKQTERWWPFLHGILLGISANRMLYILRTPYSVASRSFRLPPFQPS